ncbi:MAG: four helix bundle protein [Flavobacteriales bacterium]|nr:four helix bundle protein [Flavobacteriales bacterium]
MDLRNTDILAWQNALVENETQATTTVAEPPVSYNPRYKDNAIVKLTFEFALSIWDLAEELQEKRKYAVSNQLFRSGTAIGALVREAQNGESLADFIHKMKIALKEGDETEYWLLLCRAREINAAADCLEKLLPIIRILNRIISTSNSKLPIRK